MTVGGVWCRSRCLIFSLFLPGKHFILKNIQLFTHVHTSTIHSSQEVEAIRVHPLKQNWHLHTMEYFSALKNRTFWHISFTESFPFPALLWCLFLCTSFTRIPVLGGHFSPLWTLTLASFSALYLWPSSPSTKFFLSIHKVLSPLSPKDSQSPHLLLGPMLLP